jgi:hypothetical protein
MVTRAHVTGQDLDTTADSLSRALPQAGEAGRLATAGAAYAAARAALDAALPAGWRSAAVETLPGDRVALDTSRSTAA